MEFATPFGIRRQRGPVPGSSKGPDVNSQRFARLKPICVELLGAVPSVSRVDAQGKIHFLLQKLHNLLSQDALFVSPSLEQTNRTCDATRTPLSSALISYVFFPIAQLFKCASLLTDKHLPDRLQHHAYLVIADLCNDWWLSWTDAIDEEKVKEKPSDTLHIWHQLFVLALTAVDQAPGLQHNTSKNEVSEETLGAALSVLEALSKPRYVDNGTVEDSDMAYQEDIESSTWDDELDLPSLDDYDRIMEETERQKLGRSQANETNQTFTEGKQCVYPAHEHQSFVLKDNARKGALAHALMSCLSLVRNAKYSLKTRSQGLRVVRLLFCTWIAGDEQAVRESLDVKDIYPHCLCAGQYLKRKENLTSRTEASERVAMFLPGVVSGLVAILSSQRQGLAASPGRLIVQALDTLAVIIVLCFGDDRISPSMAVSISPAVIGEQRTQESSLEQLFAKATVEEKQHCLPPTGDAPLQGPALVVTQNEAKENRKNEKNSPTRDELWLRESLAHISVTTLSILHHQRHHDGCVRLTLSSLACGILCRCTKILEYQRLNIANELRVGTDGQQDTLEQLLLRILIDIAADQSNSNEVCERALGNLATVLQTQGRGEMQDLYCDLLEKDLRSSLRNLRSILPLFGRDEQLCETARRATFLMRLFSGQTKCKFSAHSRLSPILTSSESNERWIIGLLGSFEVAVSAAHENSFQDAKLARMDGRSSRAVIELFKQLGSSSATILLHSASVEASTISNPFSLFDNILANGVRWCPSARMNSSRSGSLHHTLGINALLIAECMLQGASEILDESNTSLEASKNGARIRRRARKFAQGVMDTILDVWQAEEEQLTNANEVNLEKISQALQKSEKAVQDLQESDESVIQEYQKGNIVTFENDNVHVPLGPAVKLDFVEHAKVTTANGKLSNPSSNSISDVSALRSTEYSNVLLFSMLASTAKILGSHLKRRLMTSLYPVVAGLASRATAIRSAALQCLESIAHSAGYASVPGCVHDHADYILGAASHQLVVNLATELQSLAQSNARKHSEKAMALFSSAAIDGRGAADEVSYLPLMSAQTAPLVLVEVVRLLGSEAVALVEDAVDEVLDAVDKFHLDPLTCDALLNVLDRLVEAMQAHTLKSDLPPFRVKHGQQHSLISDEEDELLQFANWMKERNKFKEDEASPNDFQETGEDEKSDENTDPTRSQQVVVAMMEKALPFVSHPTWTIRMRCLRLINGGIDLLCLQGRTVEPLAVVNSLWPFLMARLGFTVSRTIPGIGKELPSFSELDEQSFHVCIQAVDVVGTLANHLADFLGPQKLLRQAMPRLMLLLRIAERLEDDRPSEQKALKPTSFKLVDPETDNLKHESPGPSDAFTISMKQGTKAGSAFRRIRPFSPLATLVEHLIKTLDQLINAMGASITEPDLYGIATHPSLVACLDNRQIDSIRRPAQHLFFDTLSKRNRPLVWYVLTAAGAPQPGETDDLKSLTPPFLRRDGLVLSVPRSC